MKLERIYIIIYYDVIKILIINNIEKLKLLENCVYGLYCMTTKLPHSSSHLTLNQLYISMPTLLTWYKTRETTSHHGWGDAATSDLQASSSSCWEMAIPFKQAKPQLSCLEHNLFDDLLSSLTGLLPPLQLKCLMCDTQHSSWLPPV